MAPPEAPKREGLLLDRSLPKAYTKDLFEAKSQAVFQHVYDCYYGESKSVYTAVA